VPYRGNLSPFIAKILSARDFASKKKWTLDGDNIVEPVWMIKDKK